MSKAINDVKNFIDVCHTDTPESSAPATLVFSVSFPSYAWGFLGHPLCCCSAPESRLALCNPLNHNMPDSSVLHNLEFAQIHVDWVSDANLTISSSAAPFSFGLQSFPASLTQWTWIRANSGRQRSLVCYSLWDHKESDTTGWLNNDDHCCA